MIHTSLSPNTQRDDVLLAFKHLIFPAPKNATNKLEDYFKTTFGFKHVILTNSGRSAFLTLLRALDLPLLSLVATQAFTCNATINPILWAGYRPLFIDIDSSFNLDPVDLDSKLSKPSNLQNCKAVVVQHTFGVPANLEKILSLAKKHHLILIEDCAHALGARYQAKWCGTFGHAAYFSFGRDKVLSSVFGGALCTNDSQLAEKLKKLYTSLPTPSPGWTYKQLLHPLLFAFAKPLYWPIPVGKALLALFRLVGLTTLAVHPVENSTQKPRYFPAKLPPRLAPLISKQLSKLGTYQHHRERLYQLYTKALGQTNTQAITLYSQPAFLRFSLVTPSKAQIIATQLKKHGVFLDNWYQRVIDPPKGDVLAFHYTPGSCPKAEALAGHTLSLPTHIQMTEKKVNKLVKLLAIH